MSKQQILDFFQKQQKVKGKNIFVFGRGDYPVLSFKQRIIYDLSDKKKNILANIKTENLFSIEVYVNEKQEKVQFLLLSDISTYITENQEFRTSEILSFSLNDEDLKVSKKETETTVYVTFKTKKHIVELIAPKKIFLAI